MVKKSIILYLFLSIFLISIAHAESTVIVNSDNWHDRYLGAVYAGKLGYDMVALNSLADAEIKTSSVKDDENVVIFDSRTSPVVKQYESYLTVNGVTGAKIFPYNSYADLQEQIWSDVDYEGYIVLDSQFGVEAVAAAPYALSANYATLFLDADTKDFVQKQINAIGSNNVILAGNFPVRMLEGIEADTQFLSSSHEKNAHEFSRLVYESVDSNGWGVLTSIDSIDLQTLYQDRPIFVYAGDFDALLTAVSDSGLVNFEVIGGEMAERARNVRIGVTDRKVNLMLKYGQTVTNYPGLAGKIFDLDTTFFDFPFATLEVASSEYFPRLETLAITFFNNGNIPVNFFSTIEFAGGTLSDKHLHNILPGERVTIPYAVSANGEDTSVAVLTTQYGVETPLDKNILSDEGSPIVRIDTKQNDGSDRSAVELLSARYNDRLGELVVTINNPEGHELNAHAELVLNGTTVIASPVTEITEASKEIIRIQTPYLLAEDVVGVNKTIVLYYGKQATVLELTEDTEISKESSFSMNTVIVVVVIIIAILLVLRVLLGKKGKKHKKHKQATHKKSDDDDFDF